MASVLYILASKKSLRAQSVPKKNILNFSADPSSVRREQISRIIGERLGTKKSFRKQITVLETHGAQPA